MAVGPIHGILLLEEADETSQPPPLLGLLPKLGGASGTAFSLSTQPCRKSNGTRAAFTHYQHTGGNVVPRQPIRSVDDMPVEDSKSARLILPQILAGAFALMVAGSVHAIVKQSETFGPSVGDIIAFPPNTEARRNDARFEVARDGGNLCTIDLTTMRDGGGSFVIETRYPGWPRAFRVHWSGPRTAGPGQDCGATADLDIPLDKVATLALAAGGYGPKAAPPAP
ncbi:MAG: hypothetical protein AB7O80_11840 [Acetobacteraceae bacterium]